MNKKFLLVAVSIVVLIGLMGLVSYFWNNSSANEAIRQAQNYQPEGVCTQVLTPATHKATGAKYTFNNGCLPPGWEINR